MSALNIGALYKSRWHVELFFRSIKQHLRVKRFYGTSANAVKTQVWIVVSARPGIDRPQAPQSGRLDARTVTDLLGHTLQENAASAGFRGKF
ncbi:MAG: transposase [Sphingomonadales bacterium]|nr:transposase [Accumulibacter sp.]MBN8499642.1 transposase [Sphingomonadales bacterium]